MQKTVAGLHPPQIYHLLNEQRSIIQDEGSLQFKILHAFEEYLDSLSDIGIQVVAMLLVSRCGIQIRECIQRL